jgi:hypothetical protein
MLFDGARRIRPAPWVTATTTNEDNFTDPGFDNWKCENGPLFRDEAGRDFKVSARTQTTSF